MSKVDIFWDWQPKCFKPPFEIVAADDDGDARDICAHGANRNSWIVARIKHGTLEDAQRLLDTVKLRYETAQLNQTALENQP